MNGNVIFEQMGLDSDFEAYERLAKAEMSSEDLVAADELKSIIGRGSGEAWWVKLDGQNTPLAWYSTLEPSPFLPDLETIHILGILVLGAGKGKGLGAVMLNKIIADHPGKAFVAAIAPSNHPSMRLFEKCGFVIDSEDKYGSWRLWRRPVTEA